MPGIGLTKYGAEDEHKEGEGKPSSPSGYSYATQEVVDLKFKEIENRSENAEKKLEEIKVKIDGLDKKSNQTEKAIDDTKLKIVESLAIFGLFIVFLTSGVQVLIKVSDLLSLIIILISIFGLTILLFLAVDATITNNNRVRGENDKNNRFQFFSIKSWVEYFGHKSFTLIIIAILLVCTSVILTFFVKTPLNPLKGNLELEESLDKKVDEKISKEIEKNTILNDRLKDLNQKYEDLNKEFNKLKQGDK